MSDALGSLERLARLRDAGTLTEEEFLAQKAKILAPAEPFSADADLVSEQWRRAEGAEKRYWTVTPNGRLIVAAALLSVAAIGGWWWFSPYWTLRNMQSALAARDADAFSKYVDFPSLRSDLKADAFAEIAKEARGKDQAAGGFAILGAAMAGPMIDGVISRDGLRVLFAMKNPDGRDFGIMNASSDGARVVRTGLSEFRVRDAKGGMLVFTQSGLDWKLSGVDEPPRTTAVNQVPKTGLPLGITPQPVAPAPVLTTPSEQAALPSKTLSKTWLTGTWVPNNEDCASDAGITYKADGTWSAFDVSGTWTLKGDTLITVIKERNSEDGDSMVLASPERSSEKLIIIMPNSYQSIGDDGSKYHNLRCGS